MRLKDEEIESYLETTRRYPSVSIRTSDLESLILEVLDHRRAARLAACAAGAVLAPGQESPT